MPVSLSKLWADYVAIRQQAGFMHDGGRRQHPVIKGLRKFLKHDDAARITKKDLLAWRDYLMTTKSAKTVSDVDLSTVRTLLNWAVENDRLPENVAATVKQPKPRKVYARERGYTIEEALKVLKASRVYKPNADQNGYVREKPQLVAAKRWVPIICAFTGARVSEITQLRKEDVRNIDGHWVARITPDAGTVNIALRAVADPDLQASTRINGNQVQCGVGNGEMAASRRIPIHPHACCAMLTNVYMAKIDGNICSVEIRAFRPFFGLWCLPNVYPMLTNLPPKTFFSE